MNPEVISATIDRFSLEPDAARSAIYLALLKSNPIAASLTLEQPAGAAVG